MRVSIRRSARRPLRINIRGESFLPPSSDLPDNAVYYNGEPVYYEGEIVTYGA
jgi:hypothetical protein